LRESLALLRRHGCQSILFLPPTVVRAQFFPQSVVKSIPTFDLSDPAEYPEFYAPDNRRDGVHLNLAVAELFV